MKKKILFVIDSLNSGGAEKSLISLLISLDYNLFEVSLQLFDRSGLYLSLLPEEVKILDVPQYFIYSKKKTNQINIKFMISKLKNSILLRNPLLRKKYHTAQIMSRNILKNISPLQDIYDVAIAYSQGLPTYFTIEKVNAIKKISWVNTDYVKAKYNSKFDYKYYEKFHFIVPVSQKNKEILQSIFPEFTYKMNVIYDIISPTLIIKSANDSEGFQDNFEGIRILTIGRHVHVKGYDMAIDAAEMLKKSRINFRWYSIGEGPLTAELKQLVKEKELEKYFIFLGTYTNPYPFIKQCDIYCQPSRFEGFGMAIAEAKIFEKPIIATNFEIIYEQIENEINGLIVEQNAEAIYNALKGVINKDYLKNKISLDITSLQNDVENKITEFINLIS